MAVEIRPYAESMIPAVREFNRRLREGGSSWRFPESHVSRDLPRREGASAYEEYFLACDGEQVHGGYILKHQIFCFHGKTVPGAFCRLPLSEGIVDRRFALVGVQLIRDALRNRSVLISTGMGGMDQPYPQLLRSLGWGLHPVPFRFKVLRPFRFLRGITFLRASAARRIALDLAAFSGLGWLALRLAGARTSRRVAANRAVRVELVPEFDGWVDELWRECRDAYALAAVRDADLLAALYPADRPRFLRLKVHHGERPIGWAVVLDTAMAGHTRFGSLRVGSIADTFAHPDQALRVTHAATRFLEQRGVDLIVGNQCHEAWRRALDACGFLGGPSNFLLAVSRDVRSVLHPFEANVGSVHVNRGDGDGPIHP